MKRAHLIIISISLMVIATIVLLNQNNEIATPGNPVVSPSKKYLLQVVEGFDGSVEYNRFDIVKIGETGSDSKVVFSSQDTFRTRDTLYFLWDNEDRVWVYSGDVGVYYWTRLNDTVWEKHTHQDGDIAPPETLKKLKPAIFQNSN